MKYEQALAVVLWVILATATIFQLFGWRNRHSVETLSKQNQIEFSLGLVGNKQTGRLECPTGTQITVKEGRFFCAGTTNQNHPFNLCNPVTSTGEPNPQTTNRADALAYAQQMCDSKLNCELSVPGAVLPGSCDCKGDIGFDIRYTCEPTSL